MFFSHATASRIKSYKQCQFKYFLEYVLQYPPMRGGTIYTEKGSAVHEALENYTNSILDKTENANPDWQSILIDYYAKTKLWEMDNRKPEKGGFPHPVQKTCESCPWATKDGQCEIAKTDIVLVNGCPRPNFEDDVALIEKTLTRKDFDPLAIKETESGPKFVRKIIGAEVPFDMEIEGVRTKGVIDLVTERDEETLEIIDYKTGAPMTYDKAVVDPQVRIYGLVARKMYPKYKYIFVTLFYLKKKEVMVPLSEKHDEKTIISLKNVKEEIESNTEPSAVNPTKYGFPCDWCVGKDNCNKIRDKFTVDGKFVLPTIECILKGPDDECGGSLYPMDGQNITPDSADKILYVCSHHSKMLKSERDAAKEEDSDSD